MDLIDETIAYAKVVETKEEIKPIFDAAEMYITNALEQKDIKENEKNPLFRLAVKMLFTHWYDNREPIGKADKLSYGLDAIISQLQNLQEVSE